MQNNVFNPVWHEKLLITSQKERSMNGSNALGAGEIFRKAALQGEASRGRKSWKVGSLQSPQRALFNICFVLCYVCGLLSAACCIRFKEAWPCRCDSGTIKLLVLKKNCVSLQWWKAWKLQVQGFLTAYSMEKHPLPGKLSNVEVEIEWQRPNLKPRLSLPCLKLSCSYHEVRTWGGTFCI